MYVVYSLSFARWVVGVKLSRILLYSIHGCKESSSLPDPMRLEAPEEANTGRKFIQPERSNSCGRNLPGPSRPEAPSVMIPEIRILPPERCGEQLLTDVEQTLRSRQPSHVSLSTPDGEDPRLVVDAKTNTLPPSEQPTSAVLIHEWGQNRPIRIRTLARATLTGSIGHNGSRRATIGASLTELLTSRDKYGTSDRNRAVDRPFPSYSRTRLFVR